MARTMIVPSIVPALFGLVRDTARINSPAMIARKMMKGVYTQDSLFYLPVESIINQFRSQIRERRCDYAVSRDQKEMARPAGLEPAAPSLEGSCSIRLSYGRVVGTP